MKIIVSGGGTGGHIYPALAIADEIKRRYTDAQILYVGCADSLEMDLAARAGFDFACVEVKGMPRRFNKKSFIALRALLKGLRDAKKIVRAFKPDVVIGTGGYVSFPILYEASKYGIPTLLQEQNAYPGISNKLLSRWADRVCIAYEDAAMKFKHPERCIMTGNPVRTEFLSTLKNGMKCDKKQVLIFGGSGGQKSLNDAFIHSVEEFSKKDYVIIHISGKNHYEKMINQIKENGMTLSSNVSLLPYSHELPALMNCSDLIITSSSAMALAEISYLGKPSILVPKSYTAENHQEYNARVFESKGAAKMILEKDLTHELLIKLIDDVLNDDVLLFKMKQSSQGLGKPDATGKIADEVELLAYKKHCK